MVDRGDAEAALEVVDVGCALIELVRAEEVDELVADLREHARDGAFGGASHGVTLLVEVYELERNREPRAGLVPFRAARESPMREVAERAVTAPGDLGCDVSQLTGDAAVRVVDADRARRWGVGQGSRAGSCDLVGW